METAKLKEMKILTIPRVADALGITKQRAERILHNLELEGELVRKEYEVRVRTYRFWEWRKDDKETGMAGSSNIKVLDKKA